VAVESWAEAAELKRSTTTLSAAKWVVHLPDCTK
jgi:hypothetical protein